MHLDLSYRLLSYIYRQSRTFITRETVLGKRGPQFAEGLEDRAIVLIDQGESVSKVMGVLSKEFRGADLPHEQTFYRWQRKRRDPFKDDKPWNSALAPDPELAGFVLEAFAMGIGSHVWPSSTIPAKLAAGVMKVHRMAPNLPPRVAWHFGREYALAGEAIEHLDAAVGFARLVSYEWWNNLPGERERWEKPQLGLTRDQVYAHVVLHRASWPDRPFCAWAGGSQTWVHYITAQNFHLLDSFQHEPPPPAPGEYDKDNWYLRCQQIGPAPRGDSTAAVLTDRLAASLARWVEESLAGTTSDLGTMSQLWDKGRESTNG
jgi:hypothetical protein